MAVFFATPNKGGSGGGSNSALSLAFKTMRNMENALDVDSGGNIVDPFQLDGIISGYEKLFSLAKDEGDRLDIANKVGSYKATRASLSRKQTETEIHGALTSDTKEIKYRYGAKYANNPLAYLKSVVDSQMAIVDVALSYADELEDQGRVSEANNIRKNVQSPTEEITVFNRISDLYDFSDGQPKIKDGVIDSRVSVTDENGALHQGTTAADELNNYAVVYKTDAQGRIMDMNVRRRFGNTLDAAGTDEIASGSVVPLLDADQKPVKMNGLMVFVNKQTNGAQTFVQLGGVRGTLVTKSNMYDTIDVAGQDMTEIPTNVAVIKDKGFKGGDDIQFRQSIVPLNPADATEPGMYAQTSGGRVFRRDLQGKWDEISKDALPSFSDYREENALKVDALSVENLRNNAGVLITPNHLKGGFNPFTGQTSLPYLPNKGESFTPLTKPVEFGGMTPAPSTQGPDQRVQGQPAGPMSTEQPLSTPRSEVRTNRNRGILEANGLTRFNETSQSLFRGQTGA